VLDSVKRPHALTPAMMEYLSVLVTKRIVTTMVCSALIVSQGIFVNHAKLCMIRSVCHHAYVMVKHAGILSAMVVLMKVRGTYRTRKRKEERKIVLGNDAKTGIVLFYLTLLCIYLLLFL
jgi:hypothetical protein